jgi:hypothetical protein
VLKKLWRRVLDNETRHARLKDEAATKKFLLERELSERERTREVPLEPGRSGTDWTCIPPG